MSTRILQTTVALLLAVLSLVAHAQTRHDPVAPTARVQLQPTPLARLAAHIAQVDATTQWEFISITLDILLDSYRAEMQDAARERASTAERRAKLARWQRATQGLVDQLAAARFRLLDGADFSLSVDSQQQILILIDGQPIAVSAPRVETERDIEQRVIAQFCAYNDCSVLAPTQREDTGIGPASGAVWLLQHRAPPQVEVDGVLRCAFRDVSGRERKLQLCATLAAETEKLIAALDQARSQGHGIDWAQLAGTPPRARGGEVALVINPAGNYLRLSIPTLARLDPHDWQDLVVALEARALRRRGDPAVMRHLDDLLATPTAE